jgi:hypothetical protein
MQCFFSRFSRQNSKGSSEEYPQNMPDFPQIFPWDRAKLLPWENLFRNFETKAQRFPDLFPMGKHCLFPVEKGAEIYRKFP